MTKRFITLAATAVMALAFSPQMFAAVDMQLSITDGTAAGTATISYDDVTDILSCAGAGCAALNYSLVGGDHGEISAVTKAFGGFDGYTINITGDGGSASIPPELQNLDQINADRTVAGGGTLTTTFTDTDYTDIQNEFALAVSGTNGGGITGSTSSFSAYVDNTNAIPAGNLINTFGPDTGASYANSGNFANPSLPVGAENSLTAMTVLNFSNTGTMQATFTIANVAVPEPASIIMLGTMILGLTAVIRKKQAKRS